MFSLPSTYGSRASGPYQVVVPARCTKHVRFNDLTDPERIPLDTNFASVIASDVPTVVQHIFGLTRAKPIMCCFSTIAYEIRE
jgi:hypothetical protein